MRRFGAWPQPGGFEVAVEGSGDRALWLTYEDAAGVVADVLRGWEGDLPDLIKEALQKLRWMDRYDCFSPIDYRYWDAELAPYLSENGFVLYKSGVEVALVSALVDRGFCDTEVLTQIEMAASELTAKEVYEEEDRIRHDIRAQANRLQARMSDDARRWVHWCATSYDIVETANAARYRDAISKVVLPRLAKLLDALVEQIRAEAATLQIGRSHGQHAVPITFGHALAKYAHSLNEVIGFIQARADDLAGKFSGAVGSYNALSLTIDDPEQFEAEVTGKLGVRPARHATQIVPTEPLMRLLFELVTASGVIGGLGDDIRHLQRTEIGEVREPFKADQVGSSTMPQKRNPIASENAKSMWKIEVGRFMTVLLQQQSEHQRDLTSSASARCDGEIIAYLAYQVQRMTRVIKGLNVYADKMLENLELTAGSELAEPLYILLAHAGHPDAHEAVRRMTLVSEQEGQPLETVWQSDPEALAYLEKLEPERLAVLTNPMLYQGKAQERALEVAQSAAETVCSIIGHELPVDFSLMASHCVSCSAELEDDSKFRN